MNDNALVQAYSGWRPIRPHRPPHMGDNGKPTNKKLELPVIPAIRFFDNLAYIGDQFVGCFAVYTSEGLILLDSTEPEPRNIEIIENGLHDLGFTGHDVKAVLVTHGHGDHFGQAEYLQKTYGAKIYMSKIDDAFARDRTQFSPFGYYLETELDGHLEDGADFTLGDTTVRVAWTPGHTPGCLSFIVPVYDEGRLHHAALWGGTGLPRDDLQALKDYRDSATKFSKTCDEFDVDVEIATHPFVDNSIERFEVVRNIFDGVANPFVVGRDACRRYEAMFLNMALRKIGE